MVFITAGTFFLLMWLFEEQISQMVYLWRVERNLKRRGLTTDEAIRRMNIDYQYILSGFCKDWSVSKTCKSLKVYRY